MPKYFHTHSGVPCNPPANDCDQPGEVVECVQGNKLGIGGGVWYCVHSFGGQAPNGSTVLPEGENVEDHIEDGNGNPGGGAGSGSGASGGPAAPDIHEHTCQSYNRGVAYGIEWGGGVSSDPAEAARIARQDADTRCRRRGASIGLRHTCAGPCKKFLFVHVELSQPDLTGFGSTLGSGPSYTATVFASWRLDVACRIPPAKEGDDKSKGTKGENSSGKKSGKSGPSKEKENRK